MQEERVRRRVAGKIALCLSIAVHLLILNALLNLNSVKKIKKNSVMTTSIRYEESILEDVKKDEDKRLETKNNEDQHEIKKYEEIAKKTEQKKQTEKIESEKSEEKENPEYGFEGLEFQIMPTIGFPEDEGEINWVIDVTYNEFGEFESLEIIKKNRESISFEEAIYEGFYMSKIKPTGIKEKRRFEVNFKDEEKQKNRIMI